MRVLRTIRGKAYLTTVEISFCKKVEILATVTCHSFFGDSLFQEALQDAPSRPLILHNYYKSLIISCLTKVDTNRTKPMDDLVTRSMV